MSPKVWRAAPRPPTAPPPGSTYVPKAAARVGLRTKLPELIQLLLTGPSLKDPNRGWRTGLYCL